MFAVRLSGQRDGGPADEPGVAGEARGHDGGGPLLRVQAWLSGPGGHPLQQGQTSHHGAVTMRVNIRGSRFVCNRTDCSIYTVIIIIILSWKIFRYTGCIINRLICYVIIIINNNNDDNIQGSRFIVSYTGCIINRSIYDVITIIIILCREVVQLNWLYYNQSVNL